MNEVKNTTPPAVMLERGASSKGSDNALVQLTPTGKSLPVDTQAEQGGKAEAVVATSSDVDQAVTQMNEFIQKEQRDLQFSIDDSTGSTVVKVTDRSSGELIRQIPNQVFLDLAAHAEKDEAISLISVYS